MACGLALAACAGLLAGEVRAASERVDQEPAGLHGGHGRGHLPKGTVWVVNRDGGGSLTIFDAGSGKVLRTLPGIGAGAHDICLAERAGKAFVMAESIHAVNVIDMETLETEAIPVGPMPHHCELSPDGHTLYVSLSAHTAAPGAWQLAVIDVDDHSVEYRMTSANTAARAHGPALSPDGDTLYVAHDIGAEVTGVELETGDIVLSVPEIARAEEAVATKDGDWVWATSRGSDKVLRIDLRNSGVPPRSVAVGTEPESVMLTPSEHVLAVSLRATAAVSFVDTRRLTLLASVPLASPGTCGATDAEKRGLGDLAAMSHDGHHVFATFDHGAGCVGGVSVVDVRTRRVIATWPYPVAGRPHGIAYSRRKARFREQ